MYFPNSSLGPKKLPQESRMTGNCKEQEKPFTEGTKTNMRIFPEVATRDCKNRYLLVKERGSFPPRIKQIN